MKFQRFGALAAATLFAAAACQSTPTGSGAASGGASAAPSVGGTSTAPSVGGTSTAPSVEPSVGGSTEAIKIGVDLPLSGGEVANGVPTLNGIQLAVDQFNEAGTLGRTIELSIQDDAVNGVHDPDQGATNANTLVADPAVVGMVGPFNSNVARAIIPVTNEAGLAQCSPSNTGVDLTKEGSEVYRPENPDQRNYFRVATPDDVQGPAAAAYAYNDLGTRAAYVVDDTEAFGVGVANSFSAEFEALGGTIVKRDGNDYATNTDFTALLTAARAQNPDVVYFGGTQVTGGGQLRKQMGQLDMLAIPFVGPDGTTDLQAGGQEGGFITLAGVENSADVHGTVAGANALELPQAAAFNEAYQAAYDEDPGAYSALAAACTQALLQAIEASLESAGDDMVALRAAVREYVFSGEPVDTVIGEIAFDENGDSTQKYISFYKTDPSLNDGAGGWVFVKQQDFAAEGGEATPAPSDGGEESAAPSDGGESPSPSGS